MRRLLFPLLLLASACHPPVTPAPVAPLTPSDVATAAALITPEKVLQRISVIADDSMGGRDTPSQGLENTAGYLANHYRDWGFTPLGDNGSWLQRYTVVRAKPAPLAALTLEENGVTSTHSLDRWAMVSGPMTGAPVRGRVLVVAGPATVQDVDTLSLADRIVLFVQREARADTNRQVVRALLARRPLALINVVGGDPQEFLATAAAARGPEGGRVEVMGLPTGGVLQVTIHDSLLAGDPAFPTRPDWNRLRNSAVPVVRDAPPNVSAMLAVAADTTDGVSAPNVVALMEGNDPELRNEYVVFSAHMDHIGIARGAPGGCRAKAGDSICNGADDDGSGTTGVLSIAEAIASLKGRLARSVIILNVSGEEKGLLGSAWFVNHPPVPISQIVADINFDMIGRNSPDSIVVIGKDQSDLGGILAQIQAAHPELGLVAADDIWPAENFYSRSDHYNFARKGVPILFFFNGLHPQYHQPDDEVGLINPGKIARVAQLGFYLGVHLATTPARPRQFATGR